MLPQPTPTSAAAGIDIQRPGASPKPTMPTAMTSPERRITGRGPNRSASRSPASRVTAIASAKTEKVSAVTNGPAPFHSRIRSADHSIIAPSIRSAPIGTRQIIRSARRRQREAALRLRLGRRVVGQQPEREEDRRRREQRLQHQLLRQEAHAALGEGAAEHRARPPCRSSRRRGTAS